MDDEFALCWNNFQDNIATGFQNLYDRGDLVDVTIACDGKLLHAHKIVLAICSPYFQEMFITNPCKHPIIILKDVSYNVMCELLQFMYQGVVNVKHTELSSFMKIAQTLHVKGLATSSSSQKSPSHHAQQSTSNNNNNNNNKNGGNGNNNNNSNNNHNNSTENSGNNVIETKINSLAYTTNNKNISSENLSASSLSAGGGSGIGSLKRNASEFFNNSLEGISIYPKKQMKRFSIEHNNSDHDINNDSMDNMNSSSDDVFLPPIPQISMIESRFDINNIKTEGNNNNNNNSEFISSGGSSTSSSMRNALPPPFNFEYGMYAAAANKSIEYPNDLHMPNDYPKGIGNHMDIPSVAPGERWFHGKLEFMLSQRGKPLLVHDGHTFGIQYIRKDKKYWQCNLSRKFNCKARVTTTETGEIIVTNNEHCHTEIRQHLRKDYHRNKLQNHNSNNDNSNLTDENPNRNTNNSKNNNHITGHSNNNNENSNNWEKPKKETK